MFVTIKVDDKGVLVFSPLLGEGHAFLEMTSDEATATIEAFSNPDFWTLFLASVKASITNED